MNERDQMRTLVHDCGFAVRKLKHRMKCKPTLYNGRVGWMLAGKAQNSNQELWGDFRFVYFPGYPEGGCIFPMSGERGTLNVRRHMTQSAFEDIVDNPFLLNAFREALEEVMNEVHEGENYDAD